MQDANTSNTQDGSSRNTIAVYVPRDLHSRLRLCAAKASADKRITITDIATEAISEKVKTLEQAHA